MTRIKVYSKSGQVSRLFSLPIHLSKGIFKGMPEGKNNDYSTKIIVE